MMTQDDNFGCGLYSVANALSMYNFVSDERLQESIKGNNIAQLNRWLWEDTKEIYIECLYYNHNKVNIHESFFEYRTDTMYTYLPVLFDVQVDKSSKRLHLISGQLYSDGSLYIMDSLGAEFEVTKLEDLLNKYYRVFGLYAFVKTDKTGFLILNN